jgi:hypothetical protein
MRLFHALALPAGAALLWKPALIRSQAGIQAAGRFAPEPSAVGPRAGRFDELPLALTSR